MGGREGDGRGTGVLAAWRWGLVAQEVGAGAGEGGGWLEPVGESKPKDLGHDFVRCLPKEHWCYDRKEEL